MAHGNFKPRNKGLFDILRSTKGGPHEAHAGRAAKRARVQRAVQQEVRAELRAYEARL